jgi:TonB family protein
MTMMRRTISRRASTQRSLGISTAIHALLLLLTLTMLRRGPTVRLPEELTEISYIQARYGENIAAKVLLKTHPAPVVKEPGDKGLSSRSALAPTKQQAPPPSPVPRPGLADVKAPALPDAKRPQALSIAPKLDSKTFRQNEAPALDADFVNRALDLASSAEVPAMAAPARLQAKAFDPQEQVLVGRKSRLAAGDLEFDVQEAGAGSSALALQIPTGGSDEGNPGLTGGTLAPGKKIYQGPVAALQQVAPLSRGGQGAGIADVEGPASTGGTEQEGWRTVLDYGRGNGSRGGPGGPGSGGAGSAGASGARRPIADAPDARSIVRQEQDAQKNRDQMPQDAESVQGGKGITMTISGQIQGRKILSSVTPEYSQAARKNGWEGVVAVRFTVLPDGRVKDNLLLTQTAAHRDLNQSAMAAIRQFRFAPLPPGQAAVEQWGIITIVFRLK